MKNSTFNFVDSDSVSSSLFLIFKLFPGSIYFYKLYSNIVANLIKLSFFPFSFFLSTLLCTLRWLLGDDKKHEFP